MSAKELHRAAMERADLAREAVLEAAQYYREAAELEDRAASKAETVLDRDVMRESAGNLERMAHEIVALDKARPRHVLKLEKAGTCGHILEDGRPYPHSWRLPNGEPVDGPLAGARCDLCGQCLVADTPPAKVRVTVEWLDVPSAKFEIDGLLHVNDLRYEIGKKCTVVLYQCSAPKWAKSLLDSARQPGAQ